MKQGIVKFSKEFVTDTGLKEWVGVELPFDADTQSATTFLQVAETIVNEFQRPKSYIMQYNMPYQTKADASEEIKIGVTVDDINSCKDLSTLRSYKFIVRSNDELREVYQKREEYLFTLNNQQ